MASLTGQLVAETYKALLKTIDNDILTASEKQITDGFGGGSNVFIDSQGFLRANKYKVTNGLATQFLKADGSLDSNTYLTGITSSQIISALGYTPVPTTRTLTINGTTYDLSANRTWTIDGTSAVWGNISGTLSNQTDLQTALNAKFDDPTGTISQYIRGDGSIANFPSISGGLPTGGTAGQILAKIDSVDYNAHWIDNFATQTKNEVKLGQTLTKGTPVYVSSANGTNMIVSAASNTSEALSSKTFGLLETGGATNAFVKCVTFGLLAGLDTSTAQAGDPVWLGVNGALIFGLANKPYAPAHLVYIGVVTRVQSNNGEIFVNVQNGFELKEIHDVYIVDPANNHGLFYDLADGLWKNKSIAGALGYTPQAQLSGTGFVKASGTTITYDNSTYLTTADAASTYQRLDNIASSLFASATNYPNNNAVIAGLALKADSANPVFTGSMNIVGIDSRINFYDENNLRKFFIGYNSGKLIIYQDAGSAQRFEINTSGNITTGVNNTITSWGFIKSGGTASQFLKADGSVDANTYVSSTVLADYLLITTAASTYQRLDNIASSLFASATNYPNNNAVIAGLALKADAANPVFTGSMNIQGLESRINFYDENNLRKFFIGYNSGQLSIFQDAGSATRFVINSSGYSTFNNRVTFQSGIDNRPQMPGGFIGLDVGDGNFDIWGISRDYYPSNPTTLDAWGIRWNGTNNDIEFVGAGTNRAIIDLDNGNLTATSFIKTGGTSSQYLMADGSISTLSGLVTGTGTANRMAKFTGASTIGNSLLYDDGSSIGLGGYASGWAAGTEGVFQTKNASLYGYSGYEAGIVANAYYNSGWYYIGANTASMIILNSNITLRVATIGAAGGAITWTNAFNITNSGNAEFINKVTARGATTSAGVDPSFIGSKEFMSVGSSSGFFWENRSGGVTTNSNWYGWYTLSNIIRLYNGSGDIMQINGSDGSARIYGSLGIGRDATAPLDVYAGRNGALSLMQNTLSTGYAGIDFFRQNGVHAGSVWAANDSAGATNNRNALTIAARASGEKVIIVGGGYDPTITGGLEIAGSIAKLQGSDANYYALTTSGSYAYLRIQSQVGGSGNFRDAYFIQNTYNSTSNGVLAGSAYLYFANQQQMEFVWSGVSKIQFTSGGSAIFGSDVFTYNNGGIFFSGGGSYGTGIFQNGSGLNLQVSGSPVVKIAYTTGNVQFTGSATFAGGISVNPSNNVTSATGSISFYDQVNITTSNIKFNNTATWGTIGNVTGYATYLSMDTATRGWVFRYNSDGAFNGTNVAAIQNDTGAFTTGSSYVGRPTHAQLNVCQGLGAATLYRDIDLRGSWAAGEGHAITAIHGSSGTNIVGQIVFQHDGPGSRIKFGRLYHSGDSSTYSMELVSTSGSTANLTVLGSVTATSFFESSDIRLKTLIDGSAQVAGIENLEAKLYEKNGKIELGYFAQDAEIFMPYAVTKNADGFLTLSYREVHTAKIARLEKEVTELKAKLNAA